MKVAVRYYTKTGNTKKLAEAIAEAVGAEALSLNTPIEEPVDILFLGNSYYAFSIDPEVRNFVRSLDSSKIGRIVNFGSAAMLNSTWKKVKACRWMSGNSIVRVNSKVCTKADRMRKI